MLKQYRKDLEIKNKEKRVKKDPSSYRSEKLDPIWHIIREWGTDTTDMTVQGNADVHPSRLERVLYMAGFLMSKGIDVNKELYRWENYGTCKDVRKLYKPWNRLLSDKKVSDFAKGYRKLKKQMRPLDYKLWKTEKIAELNASWASLSDLSYEMLSYLEQLRENPENVRIKRQALYTYSFLRELAGADKAENLPIELIDQINKEWLNRSSVGMIDWIKKHLPYTFHEDAAGKAEPVKG